MHFYFYLNTTHQGSTKLYIYEQSCYVCDDEVWKFIWWLLNNRRCLVTFSCSGTF